MNDKIKQDLVKMKKKLTEYINKGRMAEFHGLGEESTMAVKPDKSKIKPLAKMKNYEGNFLAVDCSTRTLKRANNWGVYLMRVAYASVEGRNVARARQELLCSRGGCQEFVNPRYERAAS